MSDYDRASLDLRGVPPALEVLSLIGYYRVAGPPVWSVGLKKFDLDCGTIVRPLPAFPPSVTSLRVHVGDEEQHMDVARLVLGLDRLDSLSLRGTLRNFPSTMPSLLTELTLEVC